MKIQRKYISALKGLLKAAGASEPGDREALIRTGMGIEEALTALAARHTIVLVTNNTKQAARVADETAFFLMGELVEHGPTRQLFTVPRDTRTNDYVTGRFG